MTICLTCLKKLVAEGHLSDAEAEWHRVRLPTAIDTCNWCHLLKMCFDDFDSNEIQTQVEAHHVAPETSP